MATASKTASANLQLVKEWVNVGFPKQATETYLASTTFMKQLTVSAVSQIAYLRHAYSEENFITEKFAGIRMKLLSAECNDESAQFLIDALSKSFEAFDKKYLHKLVVCFYENEYSVQNLIEYYMFEYTYSGPDISITVSSNGAGGASNRACKYPFASVTAETIKMLRNCIVLCESMPKKLPEDIEVSVRLYYNEDAPDGYQAPGFLSTAEVQDHLEHVQPVGARFEALKMGLVETGFHRLTVTCRVREPEYLSQMTSQSQNQPMTRNSSSNNSEQNETGRVLCPCGMDDLGADMLCCDYCATLQHVACFGRFRVVSPHCCVLCALVDPTRAGIEPTLTKLSHASLKSLCLLRRVLSWGAGRGSLSKQELMHRFQLTDININKLLQLIDSRGAFEPTDGDVMSPRKIIPLQWQRMTKQYFIEPATRQGLELVDRLLQESLSPKQDPLAARLLPMEHATLRHASVMGKMIKPPQNGTPKDDATLKQYKEALFTNEPMDEEMPLSGNHNPVPDVEMIGKKSGKRKIVPEGNRRFGDRKKAKLTRK